MKSQELNRLRTIWWLLKQQGGTVKLPQDWQRTVPENFAVICTSNQLDDVFTLHAGTDLEREPAGAVSGSEVAPVAP